MTRTPRGIRNHNPGNIRHGDQWEGMAEQQNDPSFVQFVAPEWGIRAMARILNRYYTVYGLTTINAIVGRWAPPVENNTGAYVNHLAAVLDVAPDQPLDFGLELPGLIAAIIRHENGQQPYSAEIIRKGISLA